MGSLTVTDFQDYLEMFPDNAENLTTRLQGCRNYYPYTPGDFTTTSLTDAPLAVRAKLEQPYQWTAVAGVQLQARYSYAANSPPLSTLFDVLDHGQAEARRVNEIYSELRNFYVGTVFTPPGRTLDIGDIWNVTYPIGTLTEGQ